MATNLHNMVSSVCKVSGMVNGCLLHEIAKDIFETRSLSGDIVELGCFNGMTSLFMKKVMDCCDIKKELHVYDSFNGFPEPIIEDVDLTGQNIFQKGNVKATLDNLQSVWIGHDLPHIHKGWFEDTLSQSLPDQICFGFLDSDCYESIAVSLKHVWDKLVQHGRLIVHDYEIFPGVKKACGEFLEGKKATMKKGDNFLFIKKS